MDGQAAPSRVQHASYRSRMLKRNNTLVNVREGADLPEAGSGRRKDSIFSAVKDLGSKIVSPRKQDEDTTSSGSEDNGTRIMSNGKPSQRPPVSLKTWVLNWLQYFRANFCVVNMLALHLLATLVVFQHFFTKKWLQLEDPLVLPPLATNYWRKHIIPPIEFGLMHVIMLQMAVLPFTMCRFSLMTLRDTWLGNIIPFDHMTRAHIYIGYYMGVHLWVTFFLFLGFFAPLCQEFKDGTELVDFCEKFKDEIMITGYFILAIWTFIFLTAAPFILRRLKTWESFFFSHHMFIAMYAVTIVHTMDDKEREGTVPSRSQTWKWFIFPILTYTIDRLLYVVSKKKTGVLSATLYDEPKSISLVLKKPQGFGFRAGQYLQLNIPRLSRIQFHPFSIASVNEDRYLRLFIKCVPGGWTEDLWDLLHASGTAGADAAVQVQGADTVPVTMSRSSTQLEAIIMGPYGAAMQSMNGFDNVLFVGSGSGVVPIIAQVKQVLSHYATLAHFLGTDIRSLVRQQKVPLGRNLSQTFNHRHVETFADRCAHVKNHVALALLQYPAILLDFVFLWAAISWKVNEVGSPAPLLSQIVFLALTPVYALDFLLRICMAQRIARPTHALELVALAGMVGVGVVDMVLFYNYLHTAMVIVTGVLRGWRIVLLLFHSRLFTAYDWPAGQEVDAGTAMLFDIVGPDTMPIKAVTMLWVARTQDSVAWLLPQLNELQEECEEKFGKGFFDLRIHITHDDEKARVEGLVADTALAPHVRGQRPDWDATIADMVRKAKKQSSKPRIGVMCCSNSSVAGDVCNAVIRASSSSGVHIRCIDGGEHTISLKLGKHKR